MKKLLFTIIVLCFTVSVSTTYAQGTKIAVLDIHKLLTATPFGEYYSQALDPYAKNGAHEEAYKIVADFGKSYRTLLASAYKAVDPDIDMVIIVRVAILDLQKVQEYRKVFYKENPSWLASSGYYSPDLDITDQVSPELLKMAGQ